LLRGDTYGNMLNSNNIEGKSYWITPNKEMDFQIISHIESMFLNQPLE